MSIWRSEDRILCSDLPEKNSIKETKQRWSQGMQLRISCFQIKYKGCQKTNWEKNRTRCISAISSVWCSSLWPERSFWLSSGIVSFWWLMPVPMSDLSAILLPFCWQTDWPSGLCVCRGFTAGFIVPDSDWISSCFCYNAHEAKNRSSSCCSYSQESPEMVETDVSGQWSRLGAFFSERRVGEDA